MKRSTWALVGVLTAFAFGVRLFLSLRGGIWSDEGLVLNIVAIPEWGEMIRFIGQHESHPPLFYLIARAWGELFGTGAHSGLWMASAIGSVIVPATFVAARAMLSERVAVTAAALAAFSPSLAEQAAQLRPYGLLPVLAVWSSAALHVALRGGQPRQWAAWVLATTLLLYTHHWAWLVLGGQLIAGAWLARALPRGGLDVRLLRWAGALATIGIVYLPWLRRLVFQVLNTGHARLSLDGLQVIATYFAVAFLNLPNMLFRATYPPDLRSAVPVAALAGLLAGLIAERRRLPISEESGVLATDRRDPASVTRFLVVTSVIPLAIAVLAAPRFNLLFERCVVIVTPLILIAGAHALFRLEQVRRSVAAGTLTFVIVLGAADILGIATSVRSNANHVAALIIRERQAEDMVLLSPEWIGPSFNWYFPPSNHQMDVPHPGRSGLLDFARVGTRSIDSGGVSRVLVLARRAAASDRRVWLVTSRSYLNFVKDRLPALSPALKERAVSAVLLDSVTRVLEATHGPPDSSFATGGPVARYEELLPLLFIPRRDPETD